NFLWQGLSEEKKLPLIIWDTLAKPKELGGVGILNLGLQNMALRAKLVWNLISNPNSLLSMVFKKKYLGASLPKSILRVANPPKGSHIWNFMIEHRSLFIFYADWKVGNGEKALFWDDPWNGYPTLGDSTTFSYIERRLLDDWGPFVSNYGELNDSLPSMLQWKKVDHLNLYPDLEANFLSVLQERNILFSNKGNLGVSSAGCVIHKSSGKLVMAASYKLKVGMCNVVEVQALGLGLLLTASLKIENLEIEGDSMIIINTIIKKIALSWKLDIDVQKILWLSKLKNWSIKHIYREANRCANWLANKGIDQACEEKVANNCSAWEGFHMIIARDFSQHDFDDSFPTCEV
ncbi:hypothetical protein KI387_004704, partial [Taxus chinensis]